ncbi:hypothetical protein C7212DRAFT_348685 [Tuber magnatum]|uniref:Uncharacterized protein n=1 Tax=Tuber magnatum TaxID=42249 RepID=A0A317SB46_9PEZI|nr:hypothetical protein C7212DRAFT_348685 [Tuber magnatum]
MDSAQQSAFSKREINITTVPKESSKWPPASKPTEETLSAPKRPEGKAKKILVKNAKILESLPEPAEFEACESPFMAHPASPILLPKFSSDPELLALFNLFFRNDILVQIITNTNHYTEIQPQTAESNQGLSVNTSSFIPMAAYPPIPLSIPHLEPVLHISGQPILNPPPVYSSVPLLIPLEAQPLPWPWYPIWIGVHPLPAIEDH